MLVDKRDAKKLIPIIKKHCQQGPEILSDEWKAFSKLRNHQYSHFTVNHSKNDIDLESKKHTKLIECLWGHSNFITYFFCKINNHIYYPLT